MALLQTENLLAFYGDFQALFGVDITLAEAEIIAIIGANGSGKTTLMRSISGLLGNFSNMVRFGTIPIGEKI
jgi:branched-chain amino acid transport system ATP-binding protein